RRGVPEERAGGGAVAPAIGQRPAIPFIPLVTERPVRFDVDELRPVDGCRGGRRAGRNRGCGCGRDHGDATSFTRRLGHVKFERVPAPSALPPSLLTDPRTRAAYAEGAGIYRIVPEAVAIPRDLPELQALVHWAWQTAT